MNFSKAFQHSLFIFLLTMIIGSILMSIGFIISSKNFKIVEFLGSIVFVTGYASMFAVIPGMLILLLSILKIELLKLSDREKSFLMSIVGLIICIVMMLIFIALSNDFAIVIFLIPHTIAGTLIPGIYCNYFKVFEK